MLSKDDDNQPTSGAAGETQEPVPEGAYLTGEEEDTAWRSEPYNYGDTYGANRALRASTSASTNKAWHARDAEVAELRQQVEELATALVWHVRHFKSQREAEQAVIEAASRFARHSETP